MRGKDRKLRILVTNVRLYCGHIVLFRQHYKPQPGDAVWCVRCERETYAAVEDHPLPTCASS